MHSVAWEYLNTLRIEDGIKLLNAARNSLVVTERSLTPQDRLADANTLWQRQQATVEGELSDINREFGTEYQSLLTGARITPQRIADQGVVVEDRTTGMNLLTTMVPALIGLVPGIGSALGGIASLFMNWISDMTTATDTSNPWTQYEVLVNTLIRDKLTTENANRVKNALTGFDNKIKNLVTDYITLKTANKLTPEAISGFKVRIISAIESVQDITTEILNPSTGYYYKMAPYCQHLVFSARMAYGIARTLGVETYVYDTHIKSLYDNSVKFIPLAFHGIANERRDDIRIKAISQGCGQSDRDYVYDFRFSKTLTTTSVSWQTDEQELELKSCKETAGVVASIQLLRETTKNMADYFSCEPTENLKAYSKKIKDSYTGVCKTRLAWLRNYYFGMAPFKRPNLGTVKLIAEGDENTLSNCENTPPDTDYTIKTS